MDNKFFTYRITDVCGVVIADTEETAKEKVLSSYQKHGYPDACISDVSVENACEHNRQFPDSPDVIECGVLYG